MSTGARPEPSAPRPEPVERPAEGTDGRAQRQAISYCPYCAEETLFPAEQGWECRSCLRAFSVVFRGLVSPARRREELAERQRGTAALIPRETTS